MKGRRERDLVDQLAERVAALALDLEALPNHLDATSERERLNLLRQRREKEGAIQSAHLCSTRVQQRRARIAPLREKLQAIRRAEDDLRERRAALGDPQAPEARRRAEALDAAIAYVQAGGGEMPHVCPADAYAALRLHGLVSADGAVRIEHPSNIARRIAEAERELTLAEDAARTLLD
jgi:hypothetical protein